jgi:hypothetical protein
MYRVNYHMRLSGGQLRQGKKKSPPIPAGMSFILVAGVGFEPTTFGL